MTIASIKKVNEAIAHTGVELVKDRNYFYFADTGAEYIADSIASIYSNSLPKMTKQEWLDYVA